MTGSVDIETAVMEALWAAGRPCSPAEIGDRLPPGQRATVAVVTAAVSSLSARGALTRGTPSGSCRPAMTPQRYYSGLIIEIIKSGADPGLTLRLFTLIGSHATQAELRAALHAPAAGTGGDEGLAAQVRAVLASRAIISQATAVLMARLGCTAAEAATALEASARARHLTVPETAEQIMTAEADRP
jgi:hypothetical protein